MTDKKFFLFIGAFALSVAVASIGYSRADPPQDKTYPGVKVTVDNGHGSGVHIGNNLVLTAGHVVDGFKRVRIKSEDGGETSGEVLWASEEYDVALVRAYDLHNVRSAKLSCKDMEAGEYVQTTGNPGGLEFVRTFGKVAAPVAPHGPWRSALILDLTVSGGVSGAPVYDNEARLRGIVVGVALQFGSIVPYTYAVPSSAICTLLGRVS